MCRVYYVNGKRIFCKGGWIQPDILLEESEKRIYDEARLMAEANINLIGSEDMPSPSEIWFESFDKYGLMWWHVFYQCFRRLLELKLLTILWIMVWRWQEWKI